MNVASDPEVDHRTEHDILTSAKISARTQVRQIDARHRQRIHRSRLVSKPVPHPRHEPLARSKSNARDEPDSRRLDGRPAAEAERPVSAEEKMPRQPRADLEPEWNLPRHPVAQRRPRS